MAQFKWYDIFVDLFGTILSFADPITDILTVVEFYRADHKTWFVVGLCFIILPLVFFLFINFAHLDEDDNWCGCWTVCISGCHPFFPAFVKLRTLFVYLKNLWRGNKIEPIDMNENPITVDELLVISSVATMAEAALESAPQFIIQLYAMTVQQESVTIVQMVSLPVSFFSLAWASVVTDGFRHGNGSNFSLKDKVLLFVTHLFILSSRLFAVALFTVSYKWWVISVLILHSTVITIYGRGWPCTTKSFNCYVGHFQWVMFFGVHWLLDDLSLIQEKKKHLGRIQLVSNALFVIENISMILLFYFSHFPHSWYSLPVIICVCLFAVLGAVMRLTLFSFKTKESDGRGSRSNQPSDALSSTLKEAGPLRLQQCIYETSV